MSTINSGIYQILNKENSKSYIGSAVNLERRFKEHQKQLRKGNHHNDKLMKAWKKYGENSFMFVVLEEVEDKEALIAREQWWINEKDNTKCGYNICEVAGSTLGKKLSEETKRKIGIANKGNQFNKGRKFTEEHKQNMRLARLGKKRPNISKALKGKPSLSKGKNRPATSFSRREMKDEEILQAFALRNQSFTYKEIAQQLGCSLRTVSRIFRRKGIYGLLPQKFEAKKDLIESLRKQQSKRSSVSHSKVAEEQVELVRRLRKQNYFYTDIVKLTGISLRTVARIVTGVAPYFLSEAGQIRPFDK